MTFRKITFIFIALLLSLLFFLQLFLIHNLTKDVSSKIAEAAFLVSRSTVETLVFKPKNSFKKFAISRKIKTLKDIDLLNNINLINREVNISLKDGQLDKFLTIESSGTNYQIPIPRTPIENSLAQLKHKTLITGIGFLAFGLIAAGYFARRLSKPLKKLQMASLEIGQGNFGFQINNQEKIKSIELQNTIQAFNDMSKKIAQLQSENEQLQKQAQLNELSDITRGLAHTIRNPLNTLNLAIDQLMDHKDKTKRRELWQVSKFQIQRIDSWVKSLMSLISNDAELCEKVPLLELINDSISEQKLNNKNRIDFQFSWNPDDCKDFSLIANPAELKGVISGLISNAVEATKEYQDENKSPIESASIQIKLSQLDQGYSIEIEDHAKGFDKKIVRKLFKPHNTNKTYGAGMGLYLAQRIVTIKYAGKLELIKTSTASNDHGTRILLSIQDRVI